MFLTADHCLQMMKKKQEFALTNIFTNSTHTEVACAISALNITAQCSTQEKLLQYQEDSSRVIKLLIAVTSLIY